MISSSRKRYDGDEQLPSARRSELGASAVTGAKSYARTRLAVEIINFAALIVLARLIAPEEFGYAAVALVVPQLAEILAYEGFGSYLVRRQTATWRDARAVAALSLSSSLALAVIVASSAPLLAGPFGEETSGLVQVASLSFLAVGPGIAPLALLQRNLDFTTLSRNEAVSTIVGLSVAIMLASVDVGALSLVLGQVVRRMVSTVGAQRRAPLVLPAWNFDRMGNIARSGGLAALSGLLFIGKNNIDYIVLGARLSAADVGYYYRAYALGIQYQAKIGLVLLRVAFPTYARARDASDMFHIRKRFARAQMAVTVPLLGIFVATAPLLVPLILGERWVPAAQPAQILAISAAVLLVTNGTGPMMLASGNNGIAVVSNLLSLVGFSVTVYVASGGGLIAACWAVSAFNAAFAVGQTYFFVQRKLGQAAIELLYELLVPVACIAPVIVAGLLLLPSTTSVDAFEAVALVALTGAAGLPLYMLLYRAISPAAWRDVVSMSRRLARRA